MDAQVAIPHTPAGVARPLSACFSIWLLLVAFGLRLVNLDAESLWRDEVDSIRFALQPAEVLFTRFTAAGFNGPLYHLLLRGWFALAGANDFTLRYFSLMFGVIQVALTCVLGRRLCSRLAGGLAGWLVAISPVLIWYAGEGKMYALQPALLMLALYALLRAVDQPSPAAASRVRASAIWWMVFVIATSLSFYVQLLSPLFLAVAALFFLAAARHALRSGAVALAMLTLPYLPLLAWQAPALLQGGDIGHLFYPLDQIVWALLLIWSFGLDPYAPLWPDAAPVTLLAVRLAWIVVVLGVLVAGLIVSAQQSAQRLRWQLALLGWLTLPTLLIFLISLRVPLFQPRYVLWSAPAFYLLLAAGLACLLTLSRRVGRLAVVIASVVAFSGAAAQYLHPIRPDLRGAIACLLQKARPGDAIVFQIPYAEHSFVYYTAQMGYPAAQLVLVEAPYTNHGMAEDELSAAMATLTRGSQRVWLFETEAEMWDSRLMVRRWFDASFVPVERCDRRAVDVGLYRPE